MTTINENHQQIQVPQNDFMKFMSSHTARFLIVGILTVILLIPLSQIQSLISERKMRQDSVTEQLKTEWGDEVVYYGLVLKVPVISSTRVTDHDKKGKVTGSHLVHETKTGYFYPEQSNDEITSDVLNKHRGIFSATVFDARVQTQSRFNMAKIVSANPGIAIDWAKARVCLAANGDARYKELSDITVNGRKLGAEGIEAVGNGYNISLAGTQPFAIDPLKTDVLNVQLGATISGSQLIRYQPLAGKSAMNMNSNWNDPAFAGTMLPTANKSEKHKKGFSGSWKNMDITGEKGKLHLKAPQVDSHTYSEIRFINMVDHYQLNERTVKYGILVFALTFAVFFLIQIVGKVTIHPLHYLMIGLALLLFYSLLLSFSEQIGFIRAYLIASAAIILLIVWYAKSILNSLKFAIMSGISLGLLYAFLLVIVNLEVYALIVGSIGLLFVLVAIMSVTRKLNFEAA